jgi:UDP-N-acetylglucosamine 2-epimerase (non-hydrolysing)
MKAPETAFARTRRPRAERQPPRRPAIAYIVGARPNFVKTAPVVEAMRRRVPNGRHLVVHTGQHYDREMSEVFFDELGLAEPSHLLGVGSGSHGEQTARALERVESVLVEEQPDLVVVPGDVNSTLAAALAAVKLGIPVAHLEAGLRSFDWSMPEEINRMLVDRISTWCFTHSPEARDNLRNEGVAEDRIYPVGNTMIDTLVRMEPRVHRSDALARLGLEAGRYLLVTLHRPALVDGPVFDDVLDALQALAARIPVVYPLHPRARERALAAVEGASGLHLVDPVGYVDFLALERSARAVITDSGGVQEETTYLRVPCFTLRDSTERPVTIAKGTNRLLGLNPEALLEIPDRAAHTPLPLEPPAGWDGRAGERAADVLSAALAPALVDSETRAARG